MEINFQVNQAALDVVKNTVIEANFAETKKALMDMVRPYAGMIVTEDAISSAKSDRAKIRKVEQNIDSYRKTVKNIYTQPLKEFEEKCKELTGICKNASDNLDYQIKEFDERKKQEKMAALKAYFDTMPKKHPEYAVWDRIANPKWANVTSRDDDAKAVIASYITAVDSDVDVILSLESPFEDYLLTEYRNGKTISQVMQTAQQMKQSAERKLREEAERKRMEEERIAREAEMEKRKYEPVPEAEDAESELNMVRRTVVPPEEIPSETEELHVVNLWVRGTRDQLALLSRLFHEAGVEYGAL